MDVLDTKEIARLTLAGYSRQAVGAHLGIAKSTVQDHIKRLEDLGLTLEQATTMPISDLKTKLTVGSYVRSGYLVPDFEHVYCANHVKGKHYRKLNELWASYKTNATEEQKTLGYKGFVKAFHRFCEDLPPSCRDVQLTHQWQLGDVAMIDYSGDGVPIKDIHAHKDFKAQIFVAVLAGSGYIFSYATARQTRDDWLDAQIKMFEFFEGVPCHIYLDNSTSLVKKADRYNPIISREYSGFCNYYNTTPVAVRPNKPRDKGLVENAVRLVQKIIKTEFVGREFFDIETLNKALCREVNKLNRRSLTNRSDGLSRYDLFQEEKPTLRPLPLQPFELSCVIKTLKVQRNYMIRYGNLRRSVPAVYVGRKVRVIANERAGTLYVYDLETGERIAQHLLNTTGTKETISILPEHMPPAHRAVQIGLAELRERIEGCGQASVQMSLTILKCNHGEIARKLFRRLNTLRESLGDDVFENCCQKTLQRLHPSYELLNEELMRFIENSKTTRSKHDKRSTKASQENIRGADYYKNHFMGEDK